MQTRRTVTVLTLPPNPPPSATTPPAHHIGKPPTAFHNPWPSFRPNGGLDALRCRLGIGHTKNFVPIPENREGLVKVRTPDWGHVSGNQGKLKATWLGHASWLIETADTGSSGTGVRILVDPLFSERTSPVTWAGPKRYTPTPCGIADLPDVDVVCLSHLHYDHADSATLIELAQKNEETVFVAALGGKAFLESCGIEKGRCKEWDWWDGFEVVLGEAKGDGQSERPNGETEDGAVENATDKAETKVEIHCTPAQHFSSRGILDRDQSLWCSWSIIEHLPSTSPPQPPHTDSLPPPRRRALFFAGDTGYRAVNTPHPTPAEEAAAPHCPAFSEIGALHGPFDLALLPIGLCAPRNFMGSVHCAPEDSVCVHKDVRSRRSVGMHYGTVRGGLSAYYEEVTYPPRRWRECAEGAGLEWGKEAGLCDVGETLVVE